MLRSIFALAFVFAGFSASAATSCVDFSGKYQCPDSSVEIRQTGCERIYLEEVQNGFHTQLNFPTDGVYHEFHTGPNTLPSYFVAYHTDHDFHFDRVWPTPVGARTSRLLFAFNQAEELVVTHSFAPNEATPLQTKESVCHRDDR